MATLGMSEAEREAIAAFERDVITPSMTGAGDPAIHRHLVRAVQAIEPDPGQGRGRLCRQGRDPEADRRRRRQDHRRPIPDPVGADGLCHVPGPAGRRPDPVSHRRRSWRKALDQLLGQLPVKGEAQDLQAEIAPLIAMGEQVLAEGDAARAANIFIQVRRWSRAIPR